jgi:predicted ATPase
VAPRFTGGVVFVPLAGIADPALVVPAIAQALGTAVAPGHAALASVIEDLRGTAAPTLLLLDNFEQVIDAGVALGELLAACPQLTIVVTSREVLRLYGEQVFPVPALGLPDRERVAPLVELALCPSVALFIERARAVNHRFVLHEGNAPAVAALCAALDGLPLALELAAAQTRAHGVPALLTRLSDRLGLLTGGARDLPCRQQTLRRTLDWSHQLLGGTEQALFRRLSVFAGGFTAEAAQAVADPYGKLDLSVEQGLAALAEKSLLQSREFEEGELRFVMLETVREYAREKLATAGEERRTREAHAAYFLVLGEETVVSVDEPSWRRRFQTEHDNFRAALDWSTREERAEWGLRLALALFPFWEHGEHLAEGRRRLDELLALAGTPALPAWHARALFAAGVLASDHGDTARGAALHRRCLEVYRRLGDRRGTVVALVALGNQEVAGGHHDEARRLLEESLELWGELKDDAGFACSLSNLAAVARAQGRLAEGRDLYRQAAATFERLADPLGQAWAINHEGDVAREQRDLGAARALYEEALARFRALAHGWGVGTSLTDLGSIAFQRRDHGAARRCYQEALQTIVRAAGGRGRPGRAGVAPGRERRRPARARRGSGTARVAGRAGAPPGRDSPPGG